jgi:hypothetical protein
LGNGLHGYWGLDERRRALGPAVRSNRASRNQLSGACRARAPRRRVGRAGP